MNKPLLKAPMTFTSNINEAIEFASVAKIVYVGEELEMVPEYFIPAPVLLPPPEAVMCELNNNMEEYYRIYNQYMQSPIVYETVNQLLIILYKAVPIILYIQDGDALSHGSFLVDWFLNNTGIYNYTNPNMPIYNDAFNSALAFRIYRYNDGYSMSGDEFLSYINDSDLSYIDQDIFNILSRDFNFKSRNFKNPQEAIDFLYEYKKKQYKFLIKPLSGKLNPIPREAIQIIDPEVEE